MNAPDNRGATPLHYAVRGGYMVGVQMLLAQGADASVRDVKGFTIQAVATTQEVADYVQSLLDGAVN